MRDIRCLLYVCFLVVDFCVDVEIEAADVERFIRDNVLFGEDVNRDLFRAYIRVGKVGFFISRLREVFGRIEKEFWPEDESWQEMGSLLGRLDEIPVRV